MKPAGAARKIEYRRRGYRAIPIAAPARRIRQLSLITGSRSSGLFNCTNYQPKAQSAASVRSVMVLAARYPYKGVGAKLKAWLIAAASAVATAWRLGLLMHSAL